MWAYELNLANTTCQIVQNNTDGLLIVGIESTSTSVLQAFTGNRIGRGRGARADTNDLWSNPGRGRCF